MYYIRERIKDLEIFNDLSYEQVRDKIMSKELSVNTVVTIDERDRIKIFYSKLVPLPRPQKYYEYTILHLTLYLNDDNFVDFLLENNADTNLETEYLAPVILLAISLNHLNYVKKLVTAGADINQIICVKGKFGTNSDRLNDDKVSPFFLLDEFTPLEFAVNLDEYEIAEFLITQGADVHVRSGNNGKNSDSPMGIAASSDNIEMLKLLIKHGADINAGDDNGLTPLMKAVKNNSSASIRFLLSQPLIEVNSLTNDKKSCLHFPEVWGHIHSFNIDSFRYNLQDLLNAGCDVNIMSNRGELPIDRYMKEKKYLNVMMMHVIKLMETGFYVCDWNKFTASGSNSRKFRVQCETEIEVMKNTHGIMAGFSLFDIVNKSYHKLALRIKNGDKDKFDDVIAAKFPLFAGMIKYRLQKAGQRRILFNQVEDVLYKIFSRYLPATFIHEIFFYFSNIELSKLMENK